jgi:cytochrome b561
VIGCHHESMADSPLGLSANEPKYDHVTLGLHLGLAVGVVGQLMLGLVMRVPAGVGLGVRDWHRQAFEIHARLGLAVAALCALHWLWFLAPASRPGIAPLFPWLHRTPKSGGVRPLVGTVHGLGLLAVTGSSVGGIVNYLGYFAGLPIPTVVLHWVARCHIALGYTIGLFLLGHGSMAIIHWLRSKP